MQIIQRYTFLHYFIQLEPKITIFNKKNVITKKLLGNFTPGIEPSPKNHNGQILNFDSQKMISNNFGYPLQSSDENRYKN